MKQKLLKIKSLVFDKELYPRAKEETYWQTAWRYSQAMKMGNKFPPILVGLFKRKKYVVDGWHRVEAMKLLKEEFISATVKRYTDKRDMFADAVKLNSVHGQPLSPWDKVRIIYKLEEMKFTLEEISEIVKVPVDKIERFKARTVIGPNGKPVFLKSVVAKAVDKPRNGLSVNQEDLTVRTVQNLLEQLIELLESDVCPLEEGSVRELSIKVYGLLGERLQIAQTA